MKRSFVRDRWLALGAVVLLTLAGCGGTSPHEADRDSGDPRGEITVLAAASLTGTFTELGGRYEKAHPGTRVKFSFGASSTLARQIGEGAPADVFAAASQATMATVTKAGNAVGDPTVFTSNQLEIAVPKGNPGKVTGLADFAKPSLRIALCAVAVPCGAAAVTALKAAGVTPRPDTYEQDVKAALAKVSSGEVDAALVYRTDVLAANAAANANAGRSSTGQVEGIEFPESAKAVNTYPIVVLKSATNAPLARAFLSYVLSSEGQKVLVDAGFGAR
jgi:molybdate transport system substrate-binding protein